MPNGPEGPGPGPEEMGADAPKYESDKKERELIREGDVKKVAEPFAQNASYILREARGLEPGSENERVRQEFTLELADTFIREEITRKEDGGKNLEAALSEVGELSNYLRTTLEQKGQGLTQAVADQSPERREIAYLGAALKGLSQTEAQNGRTIVHNFEMAAGKDPSAGEASPEAKDKTKELIIAHLDTINQARAAFSAEHSLSNGKKRTSNVFYPEGANLSNDSQYGLSRPLQEYGVVVDDETGCFVLKEQKTDVSQAVELKEAGNKFKAEQQKYQEMLSSQG